MMDQTLRNPLSYNRFVNCSVAIQILICFVLLVLVIKQSINFYLKNFQPFILISQNQSKYCDQNNDVVMENTNPNINNLNIDKNYENRNQIGTKRAIQQQNLSPKQTNMKTSKTPMTAARRQAQPKNTKKQNKQDNQYNLNSKLGIINQSAHKNNIHTDQNMMMKPQNQVQLSKRNKQAIQATMTVDRIQKQKTSYKVNLYIERIVMRLPIFGIMVINIVLLSSYQFLVIMAYTCLILTIVNQFIRERYSKIGLFLDIAIGGIVFSGFINAYVTPRVKFMENI